VISVEGFERSRRRLCDLRSAFRVTDVNSPLWHLNGCPSELSRFLKKLTYTWTSHAFLTRRFN
jgi:hypothetical protein